MRYRLEYTLADPEAPRGRRHKAVEFGDPTHLLDLVRRLEDSGRLLSASFQAMAHARWAVVALDYVRWRAAQKEQRAAKGGAR